MLKSVHHCRRQSQPFLFLSAPIHWLGPQPLAYHHDVENCIVELHRPGVIVHLCSIGAATVSPPTATPWLGTKMHSCVLLPPQCLLDAPPEFILKGEESGELGETCKAEFWAMAGERRYPLPVESRLVHSWRATMCIVHSLMSRTDAPSPSQICPTTSE